MWRKGPSESVIRRSRRGAIRCFRWLVFFFFQAEDGIRDRNVTGVQTCALPILGAGSAPVIVRSANLVAAVGVPYVYDDDGAAAAGGDAPITWSATTAPAGFRIARDRKSVV